MTTKFEICKCGHTINAHDLQGFCMVENLKEPCKCKGYGFGFYRESGRPDGRIIYYDENGDER